MTRGHPHFSTKPLRLPVKPPGRNTKKRLQPIVEAAIRAIVGVGAQTTTYSRIAVKWAKRDGKLLHKPETWPGGSKLKETDEYLIVSYYADFVLSWLYQHWYTDYTPSALYKHRAKVVYGVTFLEKSLDRMQEPMYNELYNKEGFIYGLDEYEDSVDDVC